MSSPKLITTCKVCKKKVDLNRAIKIADIKEIKEVFCVYCGNKIGKLN